jgi:hypothetical protein
VKGKGNDYELNYEINADGYLTPHLKPVIRFGIDFDAALKSASTTVDLVMDSWAKVVTSERW